MWQETGQAGRASILLPVAIKALVPSLRAPVSLDCLPPKSTESLTLQLRRALTQSYGLCSYSPSVVRLPIRPRIANCAAFSKPGTGPLRVAATRHSYLKPTIGRAATRWSFRRPRYIQWRKILDRKGYGGFSGGQEGQANVDGPDRRTGERRRSSKTAPATSSPPSSKIDPSHGFGLRLAKCNGTTSSMPCEYGTTKCKSFRAGRCCSTLTPRRSLWVSQVNLAHRFRLAPFVDRLDPHLSSKSRCRRCSYTPITRSRIDGYAGCHGQLWFSPAPF